MPVYMIRCQGCGITIEQFYHHFEGYKEEKCPNCGKEAWVVVPSKTHWQFVGRLKEIQ